MAVMADENRQLPKIVAGVLLAIANAALLSLMSREHRPWMFVASVALSGSAVLVVLNRPAFPYVNVANAITAVMLCLILMLGGYAIWLNGGVPPESAYLPRVELRTPLIQGDWTKIDMGGLGMSIFRKNEAEWLPGREGPLGQHVDSSWHRFFPVRIYFEQGKVFVNATVYSGRPNSEPVVVKHNKVDPNSTVWNIGVDWNSDATALEIVDDKQNPLFQMVFAPPTDILIRGIFVLPSDEAIIADDTLTPYYFDLSADGAQVSPMYVKQGRLFEYPSSLHPSQRDTSPKHPIPSDYLNVP
jgi:hypothetical protein